MLEFRSAIVDELGEVKYWCCDLSKAEIDEIMDSHEEWRLRFYNI